MLPNQPTNTPNLKKKDTDGVELTERRKRLETKTKGGKSSQDFQMKVEEEGGQSSQAFPITHRNTKDKKRKQVLQLPDGSYWGDPILLLQIYESWDRSDYDPDCGMNPLFPPFGRKSELIKPCGSEDLRDLDEGEVERKEATFTARAPVMAPDHNVVRSDPTGVERPRQEGKQGAATGLVRFGRGRGLWELSDGLGEVRKRQRAMGALESAEMWRFEDFIGEGRRRFRNLRLDGDRAENQGSGKWNFGFGCE
ncbi:hypothetical protein MA16_Dca022770 [Dendrobium catenatum]|uniref:Uncharacterized protein n=1 Tax=Dendrobium catenatum TaxID=906689 RepID=A0A2I0VV91_9ASPA|nr:hypothetical protein MA16_Dca022770 [Dendrobium catenatum]